MSTLGVFHLVAHRSKLVRIAAQPGCCEVMIDTDGYRLRRTATQTWMFDARSHSGGDFTLELMHYSDAMSLLVNTLGQEHPDVDIDTNKLRCS